MALAQYKNPSPLCSHYLKARTEFFSQLVLIDDAAEEHKAHRIDSVQDVNNTVEDCHGCDNHQFIPFRVSWLVVGCVLGVEAIQWPDHHSCYIHHCCQNVVDDHQLFKGEWKKRGQPSEAEHNYGDGKDEAQAVDGHAPLPRRGAVLASLQGGENKTGDERLKHLHNARQRGEEPAGFPTGTKASKDRFACINPETYPGHHRGTDLTGAGVAGEEGGVDDGGGEAHQACQHSEGSGGIFPGKR